MSGGKLFVVGLGPGARAAMTGQALEVIRRAEVVVGYSGYFTAIEDLIDGKERLAELVADGILLATPAGSTAYNLSAQGPIIPIGAPLLALTPISPFRPRRWRGALLPDRAKVTIEVLEAEKRPVAAVADHDEVRSVRSVEISMDHKIAMHMLFDPGHSLDERILREQFGY